MMRIGKKFLIISVICLFAVSGIFAQNYKIKQTTSMNGQKSETTIYVKNSRKRTEGGGFMGIGNDVAKVEQCDLKQYLTINDKKKMYAVEPFDDGSDSNPTTPAATSQTPKTKTQKGGVVTYNSNINDTGERKQMFGMTARHIKTSMSMQVSPDACAKENFSMQTDGWYIDLPEFSCPLTLRSQLPQMPTEKNGGGCRDRIEFKATGGGKLGFPLTETRTINMGDGGMTFTQTVETLEFSKATLEPALFEVPQGYTLTSNAQDLYGKPDMMAMMRGAMGNSDVDEKTTNSNGNNQANPSTPAITEKKAGVIRIGVYAPTNKNGENISTTNMQAYLIQQLTSGSVEAVAVSSDADARAANCDYILTSDFSKLKQSTSSKIGGMFGKVTNTDTSATRNYDAQVDFKLVSVVNGQVAAQNKGTSKGESDVDRAAQNALSQEAVAVLKAAK